MQGGTTVKAKRCIYTSGEEKREVVAMAEGEVRRTKGNKLGRACGELHREETEAKRCTAVSDKRYVHPANSCGAKREQVSTSGKSASSHWPAESARKQGAWPTYLRETFAKILNRLTTRTSM